MDNSDKPKSDSAYASAYGYAQKSNIVPKFWQNKYEKEAHKFWNKFYTSNTTNFFKDRHWITREFTELDIKNTNSPPEPENKEDYSWKTKVLEIGCGVGNTVFPLLEENPNLFFYACDFSSKAVELVQKHKDFHPSKVFPFVLDIVNNPFPETIKNDSIDYVMLIFVLSAIAPENMIKSIEKVFKVLKPGGKVLFRDYAVGDMAQVRFDQDYPGKEANKLGENFYVRGDGTRAYYFSEEFLTELFTKAGFHLDSIQRMEKDVENRKEQKYMHRIWIQAKFVKPKS